jgi:hypothetical protein
LQQRDFAPHQSTTLPERYDDDDIRDFPLTAPVSPSSKPMGINLNSSTGGRHDARANPIKRCENLKVEHFLMSCGLSR